MAYTGPVEAPMAFNTIFEVDDLIKFLTKTHMDLDTRLDVINGMIRCFDVNEHGHIRFDNIRKMFENVVMLCEDIALSMGSFSHALVKKKLIKRNTSLPQITLRKNPETKKRDSGIASEKVSANWSFSSEMSNLNSENRISVFEEDFGPKAIKEEHVSFDLLSPSPSTDALEQQAEADEILHPVNEDDTIEEKTSLPVKENPFHTNKSNERTYDDGNGNILSDECNHTSMSVKKESVSLVYIHLIPTDPSIDLSAIQKGLLKFSNSMIPENIKIELVTSDIIIGLTSRPISTSSDNQTFPKNGFIASDDRPGVRTLNNLSRYAVENSETSDEDNRSIRLISSSDSETSVKRYHLKPVIEKKSIGTQTDD